jgi:A/G-specific adenine glycosylase
MNNWFAEELITWYKVNKRDLPWREEKDPYKIWLSEIILQQTQVIQGLGYYQRFIERFPNVKQLAKASENEVLKMWEGLGYYSRARNLHATSKIIASKFKGKFPAQHRQILELKGIGDYTAAAIASFAFDLPYAVVDGNVYRVLSRVFGVNTPIDSGAGKKEFQQLATALLPKNKAATYNQAIMEFGAQYCKPRMPDCERCIFSERCLAFATTRVNVLPVKAKKTKVTARYFNYLICMDAGKNLSIHKRIAKDIWQGLYEFPLIESEAPLSHASAIKAAEKKFKTKGLKKVMVFNSSEYKHLLSHQTIYAVFYVFYPVNISEAFGQRTTLKKLKNLAFPQLLVKFMKDCELQEIV